MSEPTIETIAAEAARLLKDITPGEWYWHQDEADPGRSQGTGAWSSDRSLHSREVYAAWVASRYEGNTGIVLQGDGGAGAMCGDINIDNKHDAAFIAAAPRLVRELLKSHEALLAALTQVVNMLDRTDAANNACIWSYTREYRDALIALSLAEAGDR
jgi:hypothetical protein